MPRASLPRRGLALFALLVALLFVACGDDAAGDVPTTPAVSVRQDDRPLVVTTVAPLRNIIQNVGGDRVHVISLIPEGVNAHTFEPPPSAAATLAHADLVVINGLNLELPTLELARANLPNQRAIVLLGDHTIGPGEYVFDFSFPAAQRNPNPHLWTAPHFAIRYAELVHAALADLDPRASLYYTANLDRFRDGLEQLDAAIAAATSTIPQADRKLLTYHDSFPFFALRYGFEILGAIQPSDFSEPSPREVASLIHQIRDAGVPAIFGSEVFPSEVLDILAQEVGAEQVSTLRDDDLPGGPGDPQNTYVAMMVENVRTMANVLGGDPAALDRLDLTDTWRPYASFIAALGDANDG